MAARASAPHWLLAAALLLAPAFAAADIRVTVEGVEGDAHANVLARLSAERYRDQKDVDEDTARRLFNRIDGEVKDALRPFGYYEPEVKSEFRGEGKDWHFDVRIEPGTPVRIRELSIKVEGPGADDPAFEPIRTQTLVRSGMRLYHRSYE